MKNNIQIYKTAETRKSLEIIEAIYTFAKQNKKIKLPLK